MWWFLCVLNEWSNELVIHRIGYSSALLTEMCWLVIRWLKCSPKWRSCHLALSDWRESSCKQTDVSWLLCELDCNNNYRSRTYSVHSFIICVAQELYPFVSIRVRARMVRLVALRPRNWTLELAEGKNVFLTMTKF